MQMTPVLNPIAERPKIQNNSLPKLLEKERVDYDALVCDKSSLGSDMSDSVPKASLLKSQSSD